MTSSCLFFKNSNNKHVCVYAYYEKSELYKDNLTHFLTKGGILPNVDYYFVVNGEYTVSFPVLDNVRVIKRVNKGYDFGAWQSVIKSYIKKRYEFYIFINGSVRGPYIEPENVWLDKFLELFNTGPDVKMVGTTINVNDSQYFSTLFGTFPCSHIQSMFFILNEESYTYLYDIGFFDDEESLNNETELIKIVIKKEIAISQILLKHGWNINCILPKYRDIDYRSLSINPNPNIYNGDPCFPGGYFGGTLTPEEVIFYKSYRFL
jgi:hypothetical protein